MAAQATIFGRFVVNRLEPNATVPSFQDGSAPGKIPNDAHLSENDFVTVRLGSLGAQGWSPGPNPSLQAPQGRLAGPNLRHLVKAISAIAAPPAIENSDLKRAGH